MMKVYFAGSIRGGREFAEVYQKIIELLKNNYTVLTEHIGNKKLNQKGEIKRQMSLFIIEIVVG